MLEAATATWVEVKQKLAAPTVAILAVGALEQHGPHLPLATDTLMADGVARRLAERLDALLLPPIAYGDAWNNGGFPGTLSLSPATVRAIVEDLGRGLQAAGARALVVVNGHFGNREPIALAARALRESAGFAVLHLDYPELEQLAAQICTSAPAAPSFYHADEVETSFMLALAPATVHMDRAAPEYPSFPPTYGAEPIMLHSFCRSGVFGDPTHASAEKGARLIDGVVEASLRLVDVWLARLDGRA
jgi:creatinine amidohydrolase